MSCAPIGYLIDWRTQFELSPVPEKKLQSYCLTPSDSLSGPEARLERNGLGWTLQKPHDINLAEFEARTHAVKKECAK